MIEHVPYSLFSVRSWLSTSRSVYNMNITLAIPYRHWNEVKSSKNLFRIRWAKIELRWRRLWKRKDNNNKLNEKVFSNVLFKRVNHWETYFYLCILKNKTKKTKTSYAKHTFHLFVWYYWIHAINMTNIIAS